MYYTFKNRPNRFPSTDPLWSMDISYGDNVIETENSDFTWSVVAVIVIALFFREIFETPRNKTSASVRLRAFVSEFGDDIFKYVIERWPPKKKNHH